MANPVGGMPPVNGAHVFSPKHKAESMGSVVSQTITFSGQQLGVVKTQAETNKPEPINHAITSGPPQGQPGSMPSVPSF